MLVSLSLKEREKRCAPDHITSERHRPNDEMTFTVGGINRGGLTGTYAEDEVGWITLVAVYGPTLEQSQVNKNFHKAETSLHESTHAKLLQCKDPTSQSSIVGRP